MRSLVLGVAVLLLSVLGSSSGGGTGCVFGADSKGAPGVAAMIGLSLVGLAARRKPRR